MTKTRVILLTISLHNMAGGLERNIVRVANHYVASGHDVHLVTFDLSDAVSFYEVDPRVTWHKIAKTLPHRAIGFWDRLALLGALRRVVTGRPGSDRPVVIAFHHGVLARLVAASAFLFPHLVCSERNALSIYQHIRLSRLNLNFLLLFLTQRITVQFPAYINDYPQLLRRRIRVVPNVVEPAPMQASPQQPNAQGRFIILAAGRLCDQKNYHLLIGAFARLAPQYPQWDLHIAGEGDARAQLQNLIEEYNLSSRVFLRGAQADLTPLYTGAHVFAMPSKWEGFPNALAEAMAHGLPAVGFAECGGVNQMIIDGQTGCLAPGMNTVETLATALARLMQDADLRSACGAKAHAAMANYAPENIYPAWDRLLAEVAAP